MVGDDPAMKQMVAAFFEQHSMRVVPVSGRQGVVSQIAADAPNLVILDLDQDLASGLDLLREIQSRSDAPVIITGSQRSDEADRVIGLELGADDYVARPFGTRELLARVRAVLRRRGHG
ncbi:two-component response regulator VirG, partial [Inquilinus limosus MP06]